MTTNLEYKELKNEADFDWYKAGLDVNDKYKNRHSGKPEKYPCRVVSTRHNDPNGPYYYDHKFIYQETITCSECGHVTIRWPDIDYDDLHTY